MDDQKKTRLRGYAWSYFAFHADQRMKTFHFYLLLATAISAGVVAAVNAGRSLVGGLLCFALAFVSVCFSVIDNRSRELVKNGETALAYLDGLEGHEPYLNEPHVLEIFARDNYHTKGKPGVPLADSHISYTHILRVIFLVFGLAGFAAGVKLLSA